MNHQVMLQWKCFPINAAYKYFGAWVKYHVFQTAAWLEGLLTRWALVSCLSSVDGEGLLRVPFYDCPVPQTRQVTFYLLWLLRLTHLVCRRLCSRCDRGTFSLVTSGFFHDLSNWRRLRKASCKPNSCDVFFQSKSACVLMLDRSMFTSCQGHVEVDVTS